MNRARLTALTATAALSLAALPAIAAAPVEQRSAIERIYWAQGWTHPIVVHLPIALLLAAAIAVCWKLVSRKVSDGLIYFCLLIGTGGAVLSTVAGWAWAPQKESNYAEVFNPESNIFWHRWGGVAVTVASMGVLFWATSRMRAKNRHEIRVKVVDKQTGEQLGSVKQEVSGPPVHPPRQYVWQAAVVLLAVGMGWVGHDGGELVYPDNFKKIVEMAKGEREIDIKGQKKKDKTVLTSTPAPTPTPAVTPAVTPATLPATPSTNPAAAGDPATQPAAAAVPPAAIPPAVAAATAGSVDFQKQIWPIFVDKCIYCHGPDKQKGKLRMDSEAASKEGGSDDGALYVAGKSADSPLIKRSVTTDEDEVMPPPKEKKKLTAEEIELFRKWVDEGAKWNFTPTAADLKK